MNIGDEPFIIAELSGNHNGSLDTAIRMIYEAKAAGCDAIKIQLYYPHEMPDYEDNVSTYDTSHIRREWCASLFDAARIMDIPLFSSVFDVSGIDFLESLNCPAYKLASPESTRLNNYEALAYKIHKTRKLFIASTGRQDLAATRALKPHYLLYCVSGYPALITDEDINFAVNEGLRGFSDHTACIRSPLAFIGAGCKIIEKHFKLDDKCVDAAFAFNPLQMKALCRAAHR